MRPFRLITLLILFCFSVSLSGQARAAAWLEAEASAREETLRLKLPGQPKVKVFTLENPSRLVVDLPALPKGAKTALPVSYKGSLIKNLRSGRFDEQTIRLVFELNAPVAGVRTNKADLKGGTLVTITLPLPPGMKPAERNPEPRKAENKKPPEIKTEEKNPQEQPKPKAFKPKENIRPLIMIDPGHGGQDPGTHGPAGTLEKNLVLDYSRALRRALLATGRYRVQMTRDDDRFILLRGRVEAARRANADLFLSIHADSAPDNLARGFSVYTLSEKASDKEAEALAARENKVDAVYGMDLSDQSKDVADILISLAQRDTNNRSALLAGRTLRSMDGRVNLLPNTHRFAGFAVLKAPDIPSMLVEIGFLSHPEEEKLLLSKSHREKVVAGLVKGVDAFFSMKEEKR